MQITKRSNRLLRPSLLGMAVLLATAPATFAADGLFLGAAADFALLSAAPNSAGAVACTDSVVLGDVGSSAGAVSVVPVNCTITGAVIAPVATNVVNAFNNAYNALANESCDSYLTSLDGQILLPGTYCVAAASTTTDGTLYLNGSSSDSWLFKIGTSGTGALTGTNFNVVMATGAQACNVTWWVAQAVTMTTSDFRGNILAGAAITMTGGYAESSAMAAAGVTLTNMQFLACDNGSRGPGGKDKPNKPNKPKSCNQGVGNGPESCDPGNSNQGNPLRSNDELGGTPGNPGRKR